ncbi:hypothetical protein PG985_001484 [Apiospora marii]|uniref:C2H2-type domain-containing protein n=1 Tax=Apiospora marii TaxID=335849 RepID=A0ABR1RI46_9PEZI
MVSYEQQPSHESSGEAGRYRFYETPMPSLDDYQKDHRGEYRCDRVHKGKQCEKSYKRRADLQKHLKTHDKPVYCPFSNDPNYPCRKPRAAEQRDMERHVVSHHPEWARQHGFEAGEFECGCGETFTREDNFKRHQRKCKD